MFTAVGFHLTFLAFKERNIAIPLMSYLNGVFVFCFSVTQQVQPKLVPGDPGETITLYLISRRRLYCCLYILGIFSDTSKLNYQKHMSNINHLS